ncbi:MAG: flagellar motor protein MotB [Iodobacter sp.]
MSKNNKHEETIIRRVSRKQDSEAHGGAWKVAFADFVLALMCLFLVLWVLSARDKENIERVLRNGAGSSLASNGNRQLIDHQGNPKGSLIPREPVLGSNQPGSEQSSPGQGGGPQNSLLYSDNAKAKKQYDTPAAMQDLAQTFLQLFKEAGLSENIQTIITPYGLRIMLHDTDKQGMFERGSQVPSERFRRLLLKMGAIFATVDHQLLVIGHTDSMQYKNTNYAAFSNWSLSSNRAMSARAGLLSGGMPLENILQVVGMADRAPYDIQNPKAASNRRIELLVLTRDQAQQMAAMFGMPNGGKHEISVDKLNDSLDAAAASAAASQR